MKGQAFNAQQFFMLHDVNNDRTLDADEIEQLMENELSKRYKQTTDDNDDSDENKQATEQQIQKEEERLRMREHFFGEVDTNKDQVITGRGFFRVLRFLADLQGFADFGVTFPVCLRSS